MNITLNGKPQIVSSATVAALVEDLCLNPRQVAMERNGAIVPRSTYASTPIVEGDVIEIVAFVGGG